MPQDTAMHDELAAEGLKAGFVGDLTRSAIRTERESHGILPTAQQIAHCQFHTVDMRHEERVDVKVVGVSRVGVVLDRPFLGGAQLNHALGFTGILLAIDLETALEIDHTLPERRVVKGRERCCWQGRVVRPSGVQGIATDGDLQRNSFRRRS